MVLDMYRRFGTLFKVLFTHHLLPGVFMLPNTSQLLLAVNVRSYSSLLHDAERQVQPIMNTSTYNSVHSGLMSPQCSSTEILKANPRFLRLGVACYLQILSNSVN